MPIRIYILARELGVTTDTVLKTAHRLGYEILNQLSNVDDDAYKAIQAELHRRPDDDDGALGVTSNLPPRKPGPRSARQSN